MALTSFGLRRQQLGCSLPVFLLCSLAALAAAGEPLPKGSLSGTIVGPEGQPVSNARIWVNTWGDKRLAEARSDAQGHFRLGPVAPVYRHPFGIFIEADGFVFPQLPPGQYGLKVGHDAYEDAELRSDRRQLSKAEAYQEMDPWRRAKVVTVQPGREAGPVELEIPPDRRSWAVTFRVEISAPSRALSP